jgi:hypothetical protein
MTTCPRLTGAEKGTSDLMTTSKLKTSVQAELELASAAGEEIQPASDITSQSHRGAQWVQAFLLTVFYAIPAIRCFYTAGFADLDVWWHLRTGEWILQHRAMPHTDPFSTFGAGKPWDAYSWLFELLILQLFQRMGLTGIVTFSIGMVLIFTVFLHRMIRRLQADFTIGILLTFVACYCLTPLNMPRSWWFTIIFFVLELDILMQARKTGKTGELLWLPLMFMLWGNLHIKFVYGFIMLFIALVEALLAQHWSCIQTRLRPLWLFATLISCVLAVLINPNGWGILAVVYQQASDKDLLYKLSEMQAMAFRSLGDFIVLLFALAATAALARARRIQLFEILLLTFAIIVAFRAQHDAWVVVTTACAILASELKGRSENVLRLTAPGVAGAAVAASLLVILIFRTLHVDNARMQAILAEHLPVRAVEVVKKRSYSGPLYNDYGWGGYLMWSLRMPVSIDGRTNIPGADAHLDRNVATWAGSPDWASDPDLAGAGLVIGPADAPLVQLLRMDPRFELAFEDKVAAVFIARKPRLGAPQ